MRSLSIGDSGQLGLSLQDSIENSVHHFYVPGENELDFL